MDAYECVLRKLDIRKFSSKSVSADVKLKVLEAARATGSGMNLQHWRFILVQDRSNLRRLAEDSTTGKWVEGANFAAIVLTDPSHSFHLIDAGRAVQAMQITAWNFGVSSGIFTGVIEEAMRRDFNIPRNLHISVIVGFGYPSAKITGSEKNRKGLSEIAFQEKYGNAIETASVRN